MCPYRFAIFVVVLGLHPSKLAYPRTVATFCFIEEWAGTWMSGLWSSDATH